MIQAKLRRNQVTPATIRNDSFKLIDTLTSEGAKASIRQLIVTLTFERSINSFPIFQLIDVSVPNENNLCSVFQMIANGHNTFVKSTSFNDSSFQLVVKLLSRLISEGAQFASATLQTFAEGDQAAQQNVNVQTTNDFQQGATSHYNDSHLHWLIVDLDSEGEHTAIACNSTSFRANSVKLNETPTSQQSTLL
jgi:hypothetical protein